MKYRDLIDNYKKYVNDEYDIELEGINFIIQEICNLSRSELILSLDKNIDIDKEKELISLLDEYCINHSLKVSISNLYYNDSIDLKVSKTYTKKNYKKLLGLDNYDELNGAVFVNTNDYDNMFDKDT